VPSSGEPEILEFRVLGTFEVASGAQVLEIGSPKQRALLAMLVLNLNRVVPLDSLVEELWGERLPASASASVQSLVFRLRRGLAEISPEGAGSLRSREPGYVLEADPAQVDAHCFERLVAEAQRHQARGDPETAADTLRRALDLWRGPALADLSDCNFAQVEATRLEETRLAATEELAEAELALGRPAQALVHLERQVAEHPLRERAWGQLMIALYRLGRQADALRAYQRVRRILADELGLEPTPWLRQLEDQILLQSPELDGPVAAEPAVTGTGDRQAAAFGRTDDTVVFLFTDIEASTRRWEGDQKAMAADLARHDELLQEAVQEAGGRVFAHTGDGQCAAFPTSWRALTAAVSAQRAFLYEKWSSPVALQVRMAIHAGAAEPRGDNYVGPSLNRVARLLALASGGQVVCSQPVADLVRDNLPLDVSLIDLGEHDLADLSRPERVFQVAHPELPASFPPLRSSSRRRHNLPTTLTSFVGRVGELDQVRGLLADSRLVTLSGVGGSGKTRLALEAAAPFARAFPDGAWLIELGPLRDQGLVASTAASALGVMTTGATPDAVIERLCEYLQPRMALLVLDNCEHVVEAVAPLAHAVLANCPGVTILATSREILGLAGEVAWRVPPLSLPASDTTTLDDLAGSDAAALFCERARAAQPGFGLSHANAAAVAQICHRLDGIPLALELAAARIRVLGAHDLARRLDQRFRVLTGGDRTAVPRHQTLQATMDWSHDLLPSDEQVTLRRLAVFPGSFDLDAAESVVQGSEDMAAPAGDVLDLLSRLVDKSLVGVESQGVETRFRLLETVREYAAGKLAEAGETIGARRQHRDYFLTLGSTHEDRAEPTRRWTTGDLIRRADADHDSFRSALEWSLAQEENDAAVRLAAALWRYWWWARPLEGCDWLERALARAGPASPERLEAHIGLAFLLPKSGRGSAQQGEDQLRQALGLAVEAGIEMEAARARYFLGELMSRRAPDEAERLLQAALAAFETMDARLSAAWCNHALGWLAVATAHRRRAQTYFENALEAAHREAPAELLRVHAAAGLAPLAALDGETARAESLAEDAVVAARRLPAAGFLVMALTRASETALLCGRRPIGLLREVVGLLLDLGARAWVEEVLEMAALVCEAEARPEAAARLFGACDAIAEAAGDQARGRVLSSQVDACRLRVAEALGSDGRAEQESLGRAWSAGDALTFAWEELGAAQGPDGRLTGAV